MVDAYNQVVAVLPQDILPPIEVIKRDLARTRNVEKTIDNILNSRLLKEDCITKCEVRDTSIIIWATAALADSLLSSPPSAGIFVRKMEAAGSWLLLQVFQN